MQGVKTIAPIGASGPKGLDTLSKAASADLASLVADFSNKICQQQKSATYISVATSRSGRRGRMVETTFPA